MINGPRNNCPMIKLQKGLLSWALANTMQGPFLIVKNIPKLASPASFFKDVAFRTLDETRAVPALYR